MCYVASMSTEWVFILGNPLRCVIIFFFFFPIWSANNHWLSSLIFVLFEKKKKESLCKENNPVYMKIPKHIFTEDE